MRPICRWLVCCLLFGLLAAGAEVRAAGSYRLIDSQKHGGSGSDYDQWSATQRENLAQQPGYVPHGHSWSVAAGVGRVTTLHYRFDPGCPQCVQQARSYEGRHDVPQTLPAGGVVVIPVSIRASISNWEPGKPLGFAGGLFFSWWTSADLKEWRYIGKQDFYADESTGLLQTRWEAQVPDAARYLILDTSHSNGILGGFGMRYVYELQAAAPAAVAIAPTPAPAPPTPARPPEPPARDVVFFGEVTGVSGDPLPHVRLTVTPSFGEARSISTDATGFFTWRAQLPSGTQDFTLAAEVALVAERDGRALFEVREHASGKLVQEGSLIRMRLGAEDATRIEIAIARQLEFKRLAQGWFSADGNGKPDAFIESSPADRAGGYSDVYRQLWAGWVTAEQHYGEGAALRAHPVLRTWVDAATQSSQFNDDGGAPHLLLTAADCGHDDGSRYAVLHEFGHYFDWATNGGRHRADYTRRVASDHVQHRGYFNPSTAESFVEGLATWFVGEVQRHGPYARPQAADYIAQYGSLSEPRRAYDHAATSEELAIAAVLHRLSANDPQRRVWSALRPDRPHLAAYHAALRKSPPGLDASALDQVFIAHGLYRQPYGNGAYDPWEPFLDSAPANGEWDPGERFGDLRYAEMERIGLLRELEPGESLHAGQSSDAAWTRDPARARHSTVVEANRQLQLDGQLPVAAHVRSQPDHGAASAYVVALVDGKVPIALPAGRDDGTLRVSVPGGRQIWSARYAALRAHLDTPAGRVGPLGRATVSAADHPAGRVLPVAVEGDPERSPVREIGPYHDAREHSLADAPAGAEAPGTDTLAPSAAAPTTDVAPVDWDTWAPLLIALLLGIGALSGIVYGWRQWRD